MSYSVRFFLRLIIPQEMLIYFTSTFKEKQPFVSIELLTPDNRTIRIANFAIGNEFTYRFSQDEKLRAKLRTDERHPGIVHPAGW